MISKESHTPDFIKELINHIEEFEIEILIAGLPIDLKGNVGISAKDVQARMTSILNRVNKIRKEKNYPALTVVFIDERLSTAQAEKSLKMAEVSAKNRSNMRDAHAAMVIAQSYIDTL